MRSRMLWGAAGTAAVLGVLVYVLVFRSGKHQSGPSIPASYNILLVTLDTTRADHLGCYGYEKAETPRLDGLAREGIRFARAYCPAPLTLPAHCTILTGLEPAAHRVRNNGHHLAAATRTLAGILKETGYATSAFVSSFSVDSRFGLDRGFDVYDDNFSPDMPFKTLNAERRAERTVARFSRWLDKNGGSRFFSWVHFYDPHWPYDPPSPFKERFPGSPYDGEIAYMDDQVGALLDGLRERGLLERTLVVVAGDHGEGLGEKVELGHGIFLYEETLRVPLIVNQRAIFPKPRVVESQVRLVDLAPTILDILGFGDRAAAMKGRSLVPWLKGKNREDLDALVETVYPRENFGWSEMVGLVSGGWKYVQSPRPELYDLRKDPGESRNLYTMSAERAGAMKKKLERELLEAASETRPGGGDPAVRPEDVERLKSLGYVNFAPSRPGASLADPKDKLDLLRTIQDAQAFELADRYADAERTYIRILEEVPDSAAGYVNLALAQARQKKFDLALETLNRGLARIPDSAILTVRLGHTFLVTGRSREAFAAMTKALDLDPRNVDALTVCAGILDAEGRKDEARTYYERALAVEPESRFLRTDYARSLASGGRFREAIELYKKLAEEYPEEQGFLQYIGISYSYLGEYADAVSWLERAVSVQPTPSGYFNLAVACEKSGDIGGAVRSLRLYLENAAGESEASVGKAKAALERLERTAVTD